MGEEPSAVLPTLTYLPPPVPELPSSLVSGALVLPGRDAIVQMLPKRKVILEIGVALGYFSRYALDVADPALFIAVDNFKLHELEKFWGRKPEEYFGGKSHSEWYRAKFSRDLDQGRMRIMEGDSASTIAQLEDDSIDVAYVDADHTYESVKNDLAILERKMKHDGYIIMDDYILVEHLHSSNLVGVIYAANEFMINNGWAMHYFALQTNTYYFVVLRRADLPRPAQVSASLEAEIARLRAEVSALRTSSSWLITAPLRAVASAFERKNLR